MNLELFAVVALGGLIGAPCRFLVDRAVSGRIESDLPWGTLVINLTGSLLLGFLTGLALGHHLPAVPKALLATGFCGAYTTFSTFTYETVRLLEDGRLGEAGVNVAGSVVVGFGAAAAGLALGMLV